MQKKLTVKRFMAKTLSLAMAIIMIVNTAMPVLAETIELPTTSEATQAETQPQSSVEPTPEPKLAV